MMGKLNRNEYTNKQQFLDDILLIRYNAIEYNPETDIQSRLIRNAAFAIVDITEALFDEELDDDFVEKLEEMKKMIDEAKEKKGTAAATSNVCQRRTRQNVANGFKEDEAMEVDKEVPEKDASQSQSTNSQNNKTPAREKSSEEVEGNRLVINDPNTETSQDVPSVKSDTLPEVTNPMDIFTSNVHPIEVDPVFTIDKEKTENVFTIVSLNNNKINNFTTNF